MDVSSTLCIDSDSFPSSLSLFYWEKNTISSDSDMVPNVKKKRSDFKTQSF